MKKIAVLLMLCLLFTSCSSPSSYPTDEAFHFDTDAQSYAFDQGMNRGMAESETGYYFGMTLKGSRFLFYTDKETMQTVPVCSKPNCLHYAETDQERRELCNAYFTGIIGGGGSLFYYGGKLYIPEYGTSGREININEFSLDGTVRKTIFELKNEEIVDCNMLFHRGYFYAMTSTYDEEINAVLQVWRYSLDQPKKERECLFEYTAKGAWIQDILAYGNRLFFTVFTEDTKHFYRMDIQNGKVEEICKVGDITNKNHIFFPFKDYMFVKQVHIDPQKKIYELKETVFTANQNGENLQKWMDTDYTILLSDNEYIYEATYGYYIRDGWVTDPYIRVFNEQGELLAQCNPLEEGINSYYSMYVMPGEHVFLYDMRKVYYFSKSDIETGEIHPKLLIDCSQYE